MKLPNYLGCGVYLEWRDSSSFKGTWRDLTEFNGVKSLQCQSLGYVVQQDKSCITVAGHITSTQASGDITIPLECITSCTVLKRNGKDIKS